MSSSFRLHPFCSRHKRVMTPKEKRDSHDFIFPRLHTHGVILHLLYLLPQPDFHMLWSIPTSPCRFPCTSKQQVLVLYKASVVPGDCVFESPRAEKIILDLSPSKSVIKCSNNLERKKTISLGWKSSFTPKSGNTKFPPEKSPQHTRATHPLGTSEQSLWASAWRLRSSTNLWKQALRETWKKRVELAKLSFWNVLQ